MEFIDGEPLDARVERGPLTLDEAVRLTTQIAQALEVAHEKNIVHRDIKAANVMLTAKGEAKVLDFGLAKTAHSTMLTRMGSTLGTGAYMSPEQARGEEVDGRTDLWALGVLLYQLIVGRLPFAGDYEQAVTYSILNENPQPLTAIRTGVPMGLEWIVSKLLAKKADDRYQSARDLIVDLRTVDLTQQGMSRTATVASMPAAAATPAAASRRGLHPAITVALVLVAAAAVALTDTGHHLGPGAEPDTALGAWIVASTAAARRGKNGPHLGGELYVLDRASPIVVGIVWTGDRVVRVGAAGRQDDGKEQDEQERTHAEFLMMGLGAE
jgi:hypothetical protein